MEQLDYNEFDEIFVFGPETGELINRIDRSKRSLKGASALSKSRQGKLQIRLGNKAFAAERVCWLLLTQEDPGSSVVFKDGDCSNLRADNLKIADNIESEGKARKEPENASKAIIEPPAPINGEVVQLKNNKWIARRLEGGGIRIVGHYETEQLAIEALKR